MLESLDTGRPDGRVEHQLLHEESPGSTGQGCRITSGVGNYRESATETYRRDSGKGEIVR